MNASLSSKLQEEDIESWADSGTTLYKSVAPRNIKAGGKGAYGHTSAARSTEEIEWTRKGK